MNTTSQNLYYAGKVTLRRVFMELIVYILGAERLKNQLGSILKKLEKE